MSLDSASNQPNGQEAMIDDIKKPLLSLEEKLIKLQKISKNMQNIEDYGLEDQKNKKI